PILVQLPHSATADRAALSEFLRAVPQGVRIALELRHPSWHTEAVLRLLSAHNAALVLSDHGEGPPRLELTADFAYVRIRREDDQTEPWSEWAGRLAVLTRRGVDVYAFLKHDRKGIALERARRLAMLLPAALGAGVRRGIGDLLQALDEPAAVLADEFVDRHPRQS